jgi:hypothetical protein
MTMRAKITPKGRELAQRLSDARRALDALRGGDGYLEARAQLWAAESAYEAHLRSARDAEKEST